ncbi:endonuclease [Aquimonas voraii]|nr:endonuclease [Aquimonas voraii]
MRIVFGRALASVAFLFSCAALPQLATAQVDFTGGYSQDFDTLANSGSSATLPAGWAIAEAGTSSNNNGQYQAGDGSSNSGDTWSYGSTGSGERALGALLSGSLNSRFGLQLVNRSGGALSSLGLSYTGEQWRLGTAGREDRLDFEYSLDATSLTTGTWTAVSALRFVAPNTSAAPGPLDGNAAANRRAISGEITGLNWGADQVLWIRWIDFNANSNDDGLAIDDLVIGTLADVPPVLLSTTPVDNASGVAVSQAPRLRFSESVDLNAAAVSFSCGGNAVAFSSNSPASEIVLTPNSALPYSANCALNIPASAVTDRDGTSEPIAADIVLAFSTEADLPPAVVSTTPANGATNVAPAVTPSVQFSETVNLAAPAFSLECDAAGAIALSHPASGQTITLSPQALLDEGDRCTLRILAAQITDGGGQNLPADVSVQFEVSAGAGSYYAQVNTSSPGQLRCTLHQTIRGHTAYPYSGSGTSTWTILELAEEDPNDPTRIIDAYRNRKYVKGSDRAGTGSGITYNREHSWPNSLGFGSTTGNLGLPNAPYTDTHMLYLTDTGYNADRGNMPYADCTQVSGCAERPTEANNGVGGGTGVYPGNSNWFQGPNGNQGSFQVWSARRGDLARAVMYMAIRYEGGQDPNTGQNEPDLELTDNRNLIQITSSSPAYMGLMSTLLAWHQADPPDAAEVLRNDVVQSFQGNRNPFIDHPEWATEALFTSTTPAVCEPLTPQPTEIFGNGFESLN